MTQALITSHTVLVRQTSAQVTCPLCAKIARVCNGQLTLAEVAREVHMPLLICEKLVRRALDKRWLEIKTSRSTELSPDFWPLLQTRICAVVGAEGHTLLERAALMVGAQPGQLSRQALPNYLIAVELNADESVRDALIPHLDALRLQFAS